MQEKKFLIALNADYLDNIPTPGPAAEPETATEPEVATKTNKSIN